MPNRQISLKLREAAESKRALCERDSSCRSLRNDGCKDVNLMPLRRRERLWWSVALREDKGAVGKCCDGQ